jgi:hypothetical protein
MSVDWQASITYSDEGAVVVTAQGTIALKSFKGQLTTSCSKS